MKPGELRAVPASRLWWALPLGLAVVTALVFVAVVLPALASGPGVPSQLFVHRSPSPATPTPAASVTSQPPRTSASPQPARSTTVVVPEQPVVRESDDRQGDRTGNRSGEPNER